MGIKYFASFTFVDNFGKTYYLPLILNADSDENCKQIHENTIKALDEHYIIINKDFIKMVDDNISPINKEIIDKRMSGKLTYLEINSWTFNDFTPNNNLTVTENLSIEVQEKGLYKRSVAKAITQTFPVCIISQGKPFYENIDNFLIINVVNV